MPSRRHLFILACLAGLCQSSAAASAVDDSSSLEVLEEVRANGTLVKFCHSGHLHPGDLLTICKGIKGTGNVTEDCQTVAAVVVQQEAISTFRTTLRDNKLETVTDTGYCRNGVMWSVDFLPPAKQVFPNGSSVEITHTAEGRRWCSGIHALHDALFGRPLEQLLPGKAGRLLNEQSMENQAVRCKEHMDAFNKKFLQQKWNLPEVFASPFLYVFGAALVVLVLLVFLLRGSWKKQRVEGAQLLDSTASGSD